MFIDRIKLENFRTFRRSEIAFVHPDQDFAALGLPQPRLPNINLLLGKTTLLKAIALAALGPAVHPANRNRLRGKPGNLRPLPDALKGVASRPGAVRIQAPRWD
jgi:hypothetical protein